MAGANKGGKLGTLLTAGQGTGGGGWEPTVVYLLILIVAEMVIFGFVSRMLR
jgi:hypothetical protein